MPDIIDTRDLIEELDALRLTGPTELTDEDRERMRALEEVIEEIGPEARWGESLIPESEFVDYAQQLADDVFPFPRGSEGAQVRDMWPYTCIDWEYAARELRHDYSSVEFDGTTYLFRAS
jgi:hypothetical protein